MDPLTTYLTHPNNIFETPALIDYVSLSEDINTSTIDNNINLELKVEKLKPHIISSAITENNYLFEVLNVLMISGMLNISAFPFTSNTQIIQYQCIGNQCSLMSFGITYLNSRAHGVIANRQGLYDYQFLTNKSHPMPITDSNSFNLEKVLHWTEVNYGFSNCNLLYIDDEHFELESKLLKQALKTDKCPYIETAMPLKHQASLILKNPKDTKQVYEVARHFNKYALVKPIMARGSWYLLATDLREKPINIIDGLAQVNNYYYHMFNNLNYYNPIDFNITFNIPYDQTYGYY